ncbi:hypothetical protein K458DRAFT_395874 [Lentithecium fluviatile CBS 122367]|uniref:Uncharacterized protein n=1 Tax=Lentithecium fluviatile CBS 122367 TaxID=1168545 RepID=A0A6G1IH99_9PLEO|nr:hypothetical protein K458DRAFT_395874 [Lentithecium fluviatile CBS 122367]
MDAKLPTKPYAVRKPPKDVEIPKVESKPADPKRHSLIKLPGELRNEIYAELFALDEPIEVLDADPDFRPTAQQANPPATDESHKAKCKRNGLAARIPLLLTCRYIYVESSGALYT